jgi:hypothetical protein
MCVCVCVCVVCMSQYNFGTPAAISTKLGTHMTICMYENLVLYYISIYIKNINGCVFLGMFVPA